MIGYGHQCIDETDISAVLKVLKSDYLTQGPFVSEFEQKICSITGAKYCVSVSNATAGLHIAVAALEIENGSEGITSPNTFLASSNCMIYNNVKPIFADINPISYNIDPLEIEKKITDKTKILIPVHFAGLSCEMVKINAIAKKHGLYIIEDAAHAIGSQYADGSYVGNCKYSNMTVFSFHPVKTITTGEGGAITTNDEELYQKLLMLRSHGTTKDEGKLTKNPGPWYYEMQSLGFNYRMTDMQAALGCSQLEKLDSFKKRRREIIKQYNDAFSKMKYLKIPVEPDNVCSCFHLYVTQIDFASLGKSRSQVMQELRDRGVGTQVHYIPIHTQPFYKKKYGYREGDFVNAEKYYEQELSLPLYPGLSDEDVKMVIKAVKEVIE
ncbi:MAG: UDP-4-amino-4,6-dideoxy-N-acetyl-beta-L-altrosamine transaminase [Spirochaetaceae bacterium]|nr:UDP-4-amino-4,6-dideoxy-N-acetyl-beta-L-altrosamine transaminase [Treponema sp.]MBP3451067.1 UDP-4-amino-4,6-dideoxy-N-acetyl-beta-L-altrosamine transaminase [Spirochaetaceae bacterium]